MVGLPEPLSTLLDRVCQAVTTASGKAQIPCANQLLGPTNVVLRSCAPPESAFPSVRNSEVPQYVVGVETTVARLQKAFFNDPSGRGVLLRGGVGSGKSTIARAYVASHNGPGSSYPGGVIWLTGNTVAAIVQRVCDEMFRFSPPKPAEEVGPWFHAWLSTQPKRWLVVVDGLSNSTGIEGGGDSTDSVLEWVGRFLPGRTVSCGHVLVTTNATTPPRVPWLQALKVVVVPPLTQNQAVLVMWRYVRWFAPSPRNGDNKLLWLEHRTTRAPQSAGKSQHRDAIPAGVLAPELQVEWSEIPGLVFELWQADQDESQQKDFVRALVPGSSSDPVATAESQRLTLLQWITRLLLMRPEVPVEQLRQLVKAVERCLAHKLHAWACFPASEAAKNPTAPWLTVHARLLSAISDTVQALSGIHAALGEDSTAQQLSSLRKHQPDEYAALCDLVSRFVRPAGNTGDSFMPQVVVSAAEAVILAGSEFASFLAACQRGTGLRAGFVISDVTIPGSAYTGAGTGVGRSVVRTAAGIGLGDASSAHSGGSEGEGWVQGASGTSHDDESTSDSDSEDGDDDDETGGGKNSDDSSSDDGNSGGGGAGAGGAAGRGGSSGSGHGGDGTGGFDANPGGGYDCDKSSNGNNANPPGGDGYRSQGGTVHATGSTGEVAGSGAGPTDSSGGNHTEPSLITGTAWPPRGMRIVALHSDRGDGQASVAADFATTAAQHYAGGLFVLDGQSITAMWKGIRRVVLSKALCSDTEAAELDDITACDLFLKWLADVRPLCLFVVTNARFVEDAGIDSSDDSVASRCEALSWLLSRLRNTSNLHVLFTTTASRAVTVRVAPVVATVSLEFFGADHAKAVVNLLASAYSLPLDAWSSLPWPAKAVDSSNCGSSEPRRFSSTEETGVPVNTATTEANSVPGPLSPANVRINRDTPLLPASTRVSNPCVDGDVVHGMAAHSNGDAVAVGMPSPRPPHAAGGPGAESGAGGGGGVGAAPLPLSETARATDKRGQKGVVGRQLVASVGLGVARNAVAEACHTFLAGQGSTQAVTRAFHELRRLAAVAASQSNGSPVDATITLRPRIRSHNVRSIAARLVELHKATPDGLWATMVLVLNGMSSARAQRCLPCGLVHGRLLRGGLVHWRCVG